MPAVARGRERTCGGLKKIYLGGESFVKDTDVIGIFDMDSTTVSKKTRDFLENAEINQKNVVYSNIYEFPRSFVVTQENVFITPIAANTLKRRIIKNLF